MLAHAVAGTDIQVTSAGTGALVDHPIHDSSADVQDAVILAALGVTRASKVAAEALIRPGEGRPRTPEESTIGDPYLQDESVFDVMDTQVRRAVPIVARALRGS